MISSVKLSAAEDVQPGPGRGGGGADVHSGPPDAAAVPDLPQASLHLIRGGLQHPSQRHPCTEGK